MTDYSYLVELFEYKVADVLQGRVPKGGKRSLGELREELLSVSLEPALYRRLVDIDRQYRTHLKGQPGSSGPLQHAPPNLQNVQPTWSAPISGDSAMTRAWEELQLMAWYDQVYSALRELLPQWAKESGLLTLRVLYTALENAERAAQPSGQPLAVPQAGDPLVSLHDAEVTQNLLRSLSDLLLSEEGRTHFQTALSQIHESPFPRHPDEDVLAARLAALEKQNLSTLERQHLMSSLRETYPQSRDPRERPAIREAVRKLAHSLELTLQSAPGPTLKTVPNHSILYAEQPRAALNTPDEGAEQLVIYLRGGQAAQWRGIDFRWQFLSPNWQLQVNSDLLLLRPNDPLASRVLLVKQADTHLKVYVSGAYLLIRTLGRGEYELRRRAALGSAVSLLLDPAQEYGALRLARAAAQLLREGVINSETTIPASAEKYRDASPEALLTFARKGASTLVSRLTKLSSEQAFEQVRRAAAALHLPGSLADQLAEALLLANRPAGHLLAPTNGTVLEVPENGAFGSIQLGQEPVVVQLAGRAVTLRADFKGELAAVLPGHPVMILRDLLVIRTPNLNLILARNGNWLAAANGSVRPEPSAGSEAFTTPTDDFMS